MSQNLFFFIGQLSANSVFCVCAPGLCRRTLVQTVPRHQAPDRKRAGGRQSQESQVHPQRHGPVGRRRGVLRFGEPHKYEARAVSRAPQPHSYAQIQKLSPKAAHAALWLHGKRHKLLSMWRCHGNHTWQRDPEAADPFVWHPFFFWSVNELGLNKTKAANFREGWTTHPNAV